MTADAEINGLKPESPLEDSVDETLVDGGVVDLQARAVGVGVDQSPILESVNGEERDLGEKAVGIDGACCNAEVKDNGGLRGDLGSEKVESCDPGSESDREAKPEVGVSAVAGDEVEEEKEAGEIVGEVEEPVALEEEKEMGEEGEKLGSHTEFLVEEIKEEENVVAEEIGRDEVQENLEVVVVGDAKESESMVAEKGSDEAIESREIVAEEAKEAENIVERALESEDLVAEKDVEEVSEIHEAAPESKNVVAETSSEEILKSHDLLIEEALEPKDVVAETSGEEISKSSDFVIDEAPESKDVVVEGGSDAVEISSEEVVIKGSPVSENVLAEMDSDERVSEEKAEDAREYKNVETSSEQVSESPEPVIEEVVELKDVVAEQGNEEVTKVAELITEEALESEYVIVGSGSEQVSERTDLMITEEPESENVVTKTASEEVELMKKHDVLVDESRVHGQDEQEEPGLETNVDDAVPEAAKIEEKEHPEVLISVTGISESIVVKPEEALSTDVAQQTQKIDAFCEKDGPADQVRKDETLGENGKAGGPVKKDDALGEDGGPAAEIQANEASLENGTDDIGSDVVLCENGVARDLKMEAGSGTYENGHATLLADEKLEDHVVANGSEVSTCTDTDEPPLSVVSDELVGGSNEAELPVSKDNDDKLSSNEPMTVKETGKVDTQVVKPQIYWLAKISWYHNPELAAQIKHVQSQRAELTIALNKISSEIRRQREIVNKCEALRDAAKEAESAASDTLSEKKKEIEAVELKIASLIGDLKNATLIDGIDDQIASLERTLQHETIPLKQEKQLLEEIKKLKERREKLSSGMDPEMQIKEALDLKNQISASLKDLRKELDPLKSEITQAKKKKYAAMEKHKKEKDCLNELIQKQKRVADDRGAAFWLEEKLKGENKHYREYKDDEKTANMYLASGDQRIACHCNNQVEKVMKLWNTDSQFRKKYVESNVRSTLRRLKTFDGRSLGPGEQAPEMPSIEAMGSANVSTMPSSNSKTSLPVSAQKHEKEKVSAITKVQKKDSAATSNLLQKNQPVSLRKTTKVMSEEISVTVLDSKEIEDDKVERKLTKEEEEMMRKAEELARKEEELRKAKLEAELKERLREEQKAKAKEAEERKKKQAEKAQVRAQLRAQKEAELREKKKAKKEEKKRKVAFAATAETIDKNVEGDDATNTKSTAPETVTEPEIKVTTTSRRPPLTKKYNKMEPIPLPLRNRSRRKMKSLVLKGLGITALLLVIVFCLYKFLPSSQSSQTNIGY
ncbi:hypothetical protein IHE45_03G092500 [Dioscorea alata]|uniref:Uncharacterized protein n=1 Tax=Dioscorea alata TaxID=55571 RepID=A0ACB7WMR1_DIOAL|nr:hypothetical protein IHE45_03G092500 [Dioscorea alata]